MKKRISLFLCLCVLFSSLSMFPAQAMTSVFDHSDDYLDSEYYTNLLQVRLTGDFRSDIVAVAESQVGYHEGDSVSDIDGTSSGNGDYTEYGRNFGTSSDGWCASFIWWCARQVGVQESIIHKTEWARPNLQPYKSVPFDRCGSIKPGDIAYIDTINDDGIPDHAGIITKVSSGEIVVVEGNASNQVTRHRYSAGSGERLTGSYGGRILYVGSPDYNGKNVSSASYELVFVTSPGTTAYSSIGGKTTGTLDSSKYMLLFESPSGEWLQIVAPDGVNSWYIPSAGASYSKEDLPPITSYDAWSIYVPASAPADPEPETKPTPETDSAPENVTIERPDTTVTPASSENTGSCCTQNSVLASPAALIAALAAMIVIAVERRRFG